MRCRMSRPNITWTELADSDMDKDQVAISILTAAKELIEDQESEIEELKRRVATYRIALLAVAHLK